MRSVTQVSAGLREGRGGGHGDGRRGGDVSRHSRGRDMPSRQGVCVSTCALPFDTAHGYSDCARVRGLFLPRGSSEAIPAARTRASRTFIRAVE
eukprot:5081476-Pleurochrysis_carterae.AAC.1